MDVPLKILWHVTTLDFDNKISMENFSMKSIKS
jgi:hypothetical protein